MENNEQLTPEEKVAKEKKIQLKLQNLFEEAKDLESKAKKEKDISERNNYYGKILQSFCRINNKGYQLPNTADTLAFCLTVKRIYEILVPKNGLKKKEKLYDLVLEKIQELKQNPEIQKKLLEETRKKKRIQEAQKKERERKKEKYKNIYERITVADTKTKCPMH